MPNENEGVSASVAASLAVHMGRSNEAVAVGNRAGVVEWTNSAWRRITGWPLEDVVGKPVGHLLDTIGLESEVLDFIQGKFLAGLPAAVEVPVESPDGRVVHVHLDVEPILDASGEVGQFVAVATDVTSRRQAELAAERDRGSQANDASSRFDAPDAVAEAFAARSIATLRRIEQLCLEIERTTAVGLLDEFGVRSVRTRATAAVDAASELLERTQVEPPSPTSLDLGVLVSRCVRRVRRNLPNRVQLDVVLARDLPRVRADEHELAEAIVRLMVAGLGALDENWETLSVTTGITQPGRPLVSQVHFQSFAGPLRDEVSRCFVEIHDTGATIPPEPMRRLRGRVLPTPREPRIAELLELRARLRESGIEMDVSSAPGCGTRVLLLVPVFV